MFADFVARILREPWNKGSQRVDLPNPTDSDRDEAIRGVSAKLQQLAEEIATLNGKNTPLTNYNFVEAQHTCDGVADMPRPFWRYDDMCAAGGSDNPASHLRPDGTIRNGLAHKFRGVVLLEGDLVIREREPNDPIGPVPGPQGPAGPGAVGGGRVITINRAGDIIGICAVGITVSSIPARSGTTLGSGSCNVQKLTGAVVSTSQLDTVYNPHDFAISSNTYVMLGQVPRANSSVWVIIEVCGKFTPAYSLRLADSTNQSFTAGTAATVALATDIHKYPDDSSVFAIDNMTYEITIKKSGLYQFSFIIPWLVPSADGSAIAWLEEGGATIKGSIVPSNPGANSTETDGIAGSIVHKVDVSGGNKVYRLRFVSATNAVILGDDSLGYGRLDIVWERSL